MPGIVVNKETEIAIKAVRGINARSNGELLQIALAHSASAENVDAVVDALVGAIRVAYAPAVSLAPKPTVAMLNRFMKRVDWRRVFDSIVVRPELN